MTHSSKIIICFNFAHSKKRKQLMCCTNTNGFEIPGPSTNIDGLQMCSWTLNKPVCGCNERKNLSPFVPYFGYFGVPLKGQTPVQVLQSQQGFPEQKFWPPQKIKIVIGCKMDFKDFRLSDLILSRGGLNNFLNPPYILNI